MVDHDPACVFGRTCQQAPSRGDRLCRQQVDGGHPLRVLHVNRVQDRVDQVQQLRAFRPDRQCHVAGRVAWSSQSLDSRHNLTFPGE